MIAAAVDNIIVSCVEVCDFLTKTAFRQRLACLLNSFPAEPCHFTRTEPPSGGKQEEDFRNTEMIVASGAL